MTKYAKLYVALVAAVAVAVSTSADGEFSLNDAMSILSAGVGALGVYFVPNATPVDTRHPSARDRGAADVLLLVIAALAFIAGYLVAKV